MKVLKELFTNPIGVAIAAVHWVVVFLSIFGEEHTQPFHFFYEPLLYQWLFLLNLPAIIFAGLILIPILSLFGENILITFFGFFLYFFCISFQWLIVGYFVSLIVDSIKPKELKLSLFNE